MRPRRGAVDVPELLNSSPNSVRSSHRAGPMIGPSRMAACARSWPRSPAGAASRGPTGWPSRPQVGSWVERGVCRLVPLVSRRRSRQNSRSLQVPTCFHGSGRPTHEHCRKADDRFCVGRCGFSHGARSDQLDRVRRTVRRRAAAQVADVAGRWQPSGAAPLAGLESGWVPIHAVSTGPCAVPSSNSPDTF